ncbi:hypothetical protein CDD83_9375 [Cordyceps sp. RAO-2017]|nr:hypothetical protein CDD83_9375 [Cordyceps sp. RAO-2017]
MEPNQAPTFFMAPRFTIKPPPDVPLHLERLPGNSKRRKVRQLTVLEVYKFECIDDISFTATRDYMLESMNQDCVKKFVQGTGYEPVYMITGLKIARGPAVAFKAGGRRGFKAAVGLKNPGPIRGVDVGSTAEHSHDVEQSFEWERSDDFVFGMRFKRLYFKKALLLRKLGGFVAEPFHKGAMLVDNDVKANGMGMLEEVEDVEIDGSDDELNGKDRMVIDGDENGTCGATGPIVWVVSRA